MKYSALASILGLASAYSAESSIHCDYWFQFDSKFPEADQFVESNDRHTIAAKSAKYSNYTVKAVTGDQKMFCAKFDAHNISKDFKIGFYAGSQYLDVIPWIEKA